MGRVIRLSDLSRITGISRHTLRDIANQNPALAYKRDRAWVFRLDVLATYPGWDIVQAYMLPAEGDDGPWIKAVDLAARAGVPRRTVAYWCATRPQFARRIGRVWYVRPDILRDAA